MILFPVPTRSLTTYSTGIVGSTFDVIFSGMADPFTTMVFAVVPPNGTMFFKDARTNIIEPIRNFIPPSSPIETTPFQNPNYSACVDRKRELEAVFNAPPDVIGSWTFTPYLQYILGELVQSILKQYCIIQGCEFGKTTIFHA